MGTVGIVTEYNPFHLGHAWQLREIRRRLGADTSVVVVMSGPFVQRGEPAFLDPGTRARCALKSGVDLVLRLPFPYACASAERFAAGSVALLAATGAVDVLAFGSESGELGPLEGLADFLVEEPEAYRATLRLQLDRGVSFAAARQAALKETAPDPALADRVAEPNDILGIEYLKALRRQGLDRIRPMAVHRLGAHDRDASMPDPGAVGPASATAIRAALLDALRQGHPPAVAIDRVRPSLPPATAALALHRLLQGAAPVTADTFLPTLVAGLRGLPPEALDAIAGMGEGLGRRLREEARGLSGPDPMSALVAGGVSRRFPASRVRRALCALLVGLRESDLSAFDAAGGPRFLRVLGFTDRGRTLLRGMRRRATLPLFLKESDSLEHAADPALTRMAELDRLAADLWALAVPRQALRRTGGDFDTPVDMV